MSEFASAVATKFNVNVTVPFTIKFEDEEAFLAAINITEDHGHFATLLQE